MCSEDLSKIPAKTDVKTEFLWDVEELTSLITNFNLRLTNGRSILSHIKRLPVEEDIQKLLRYALLNLDSDLIWWIQLMLIKG